MKDKKIITISLLVLFTFLYNPYLFANEQTQNHDLFLISQNHNGEADTAESAGVESVDNQTSVDAGTTENIKLYDKLKLSLSSAGNILISSLPGAMLLFLFSAVFSSINFFTDLSDQTKYGYHVYKYLAVWILVNYLLALVILLVILPDTVGLDKITTQLAYSVFLATAIPEISANLRLQLGKSSRSLDLYKYKTKISGLIAERVSEAVIDRRSQQLLSLALYYNKNIEQFSRKLLIFTSQSNLTDEEKDSLNALRERIDREKESFNIERIVSELIGNTNSVVPKLVSFFRNDIRKFESSPVSRLMKSLHPLVTLDESRKFVKCGISSPGKFSRKCFSKKGRNILSNLSGVELPRIEEIYYSSKDVTNKRIYRNVFLTLIAGIVLAGNLYVLVAVYPEREISAFEKTEMIPKRMDESGNTARQPGNPE